MLQPFFASLNSLPVSRAINESIWIFPLVQAVHLLFVAVLFGAVLVVDFRLLGRGFTQQPISRVARDAKPWLLIALAGMVATGVPQLMANAERQYYSEFFWMKMYLLATALIFTFTVRAMITRKDENQVSPVVRKAVAVVSMALWTGVAIEGRLIGLFS